MRCLIAILLCLWQQQVIADDFFQRSFILGELKRAAMTGKKMDWPFLSQLDIKKEHNVFYSNSGMAAFTAPAQAASTYDPSISYDLSNFYSSQTYRAHLVFNQFIRGTDFLISGGYDSGSSTPKISISKTWFLGFSGYRKLNNNFYFYFTTGAWQQQRVTEHPCVDAYDREYWCPTLTAWSDRPATNFKPGRFLDLKLEFVF